MIVDFPSSSLSTLKEQLKSVRFAPFCDVKLVEYTSSSEMRWYSEQDFSHFRKIMIRDAIRCSFAMQKVFANEHNRRASTRDLFIKCIGLEPLISRDVLARGQAIAVERKRHAECVLREQRRLIRSGSFSVERLASVSQASSKTARKRSRKFAVLASLEP